MAVLMALLALLLLLNLAKLGVEARYAGNSLTLRLRLGPVRLTVLPAEGGKKKKKKTRESETEKNSGPKLTREQLPALARTVRKPVRRLLRGLWVERLVLYYVVACPDPADTGERYGKLAAALPTLEAALDKMPHLRHRDIRLGFSFETDKPELEGAAALTVRLWRAAAVTAGLGTAYLRWRRRTIRHKNKADRAERKQ